MSLVRNASFLLSVHLIAASVVAQTRVEVVQVVSKPVERQVI